MKLRNKTVQWTIDSMSIPCKMMTPVILYSRKERDLKYVVRQGLSPYPHPSRSGQGEQLPWRPSGKAGLSAAAGEGGLGKVLPKLPSGRTEDALDGGGRSLWQHSPWGHWTLPTRSTILKRKQGGVSHSYAQEGIMGGRAMGPIGGSSCFLYSGTHTWYL